MKLLLLLAALGASLLAGFARAETYSGRADVTAFIDEMATRHGFSPAELDALFARTRRIDSVITLIMPPKDPGIRSWQTYRSRFIEPKRIAAGREFMRRHKVALARAEARFGVPREVIAAIIGVETIYGRQMGNFGTFAALATLAFDYPPRAELFRGELAELLLLAREEGREPGSYRGSYAGALGLPQFLPSSWRKYALDFDGDRRIDLFASPADAIGSVANFLVEHGWRSGQPIAARIAAEGPGLALALEAGVTPTQTPAQWQQREIALRKVGAGDTASDTASAFPDLPSAIVDLVSPNAATEYLLAYPNFYVITRYNRSRFYATTVMDFAATLTSGSQ